MKVRELQALLAKCDPEAEVRHAWWFAQDGEDLRDESTVDAVTEGTRAELDCIPRDDQKVVLLS